MSRVAAKTQITRLSATADWRVRLAEDARAGLMAVPKCMPPKYFYDARGSELFEQITKLQEYYPTRTETTILEEIAHGVMASLRPTEMVEIGSGTSRKTRILIEAMAEFGGQRYVAFDVSENALREAAGHLSRAYPWLEINSVVGDFDSDLKRVPRQGRRLIAFLGSTIGNLEPVERVPFLRSIGEMLAPEDRLLLGTDLVKDVEVLEAAYNDEAGVTAAFNKNLLRVLNRELDGDIPVDDFEHLAIYNRQYDRIEMHLRTSRPVRARLASIDLDVSFEESEDLQTELSCKFTRDRVREELEQAGLRMERWFTDPRGWFGLTLAARA